MKTGKNFEKKLQKVCKVIVLVSILFTFVLFYINKIDLTISAMTIIICILVFIGLQSIIRLGISNKKYKLKEQSYISSIEAIKGSIWQWNDYSNDIYISNEIKRKLNIENDKISLDEWYGYINKNDYNRITTYLNNVCDNKICSEISVKYSLIGKDGQNVYVSHYATGSIRDNVYYLSGVITDITKETQEEQNKKIINYYDGITGILNRKMFLEKFNNLIEDSLKSKTELALIFFDLDNFNNLNDTYGQEVGDEILFKLCKRIESILDDRHIFARFGGDEFAIVFSRFVNQEEIDMFLEEILLQARKPFKISGKDIYCSITLGVSKYPNDADNLELLLKTADMAVNKGKEEGKNRYKYFDVEILEILKRECEIEKLLRTAIEKREIFMVFQPKISIKGETINGFEALVRWISNELGFVSPAEFIPIAENSGLIVDLGRYIIEESFKKCKELIEITPNKFHIAINISDIQLRESGFIEFVSEMLNKYEIKPEYIQFEITESVIMQSVAKNIEILLKLKALGVSIALDDFGTGYSSLSYLKSLPIDVLKIDKSFVDGIGVDEKSEYIAESLIKLSHSLNLKVVAEGVETREQVGYLDKMKCDVAQGYYFSKPENFENIKKMI